MHVWCRQEDHIGGAKRKSAFEHAQNRRIHAQSFNPCICSPLKQSMISSEGLDQTAWTRRLIWASLSIYATHFCMAQLTLCWLSHTNKPIQVNILYKSIAGPYRPVRVADGPITACYRFIKNASWDVDRLIELFRQSFSVFEHRCDQAPLHPRALTQNYYSVGSTT